MKKYVKPTLEVIQLRVEEKLASTTGNTTTYNMNGASESGLETLSFES